MRFSSCSIFVFQAEDGIRDLVRSRGLGDVYKRQTLTDAPTQINWPIALNAYYSRALTFFLYNANQDLSLIHI